MPLLSPNQIHVALEKERPKGTEKKDFNKLLQENNLSPEDLLMNLSSMTRCADTDGVRIRAIETGLKLNGMLQGDESATQFNVQIIINDSQFSSINPIIIPRETTNART